MKNENPQLIVGRSRFWYESIMPSFNGGWFCRGFESAKRFKAVKRLYLSEAGNALDTMEPILVLAPALSHAGCAYPALPAARPIVYLAPTLEFDAQKDVDHTVAHEVAHVLLGHHLPGNSEMQMDAERHEDRPAEIAVCAMAASWGFPKRKRGKSGFHKFLDWAEKGREL